MAGKTHPPPKSKGAEVHQLRGACNGVLKLKSRRQHYGEDTDARTYESYLHGIEDTLRNHQMHHLLQPCICAEHTIFCAKGWRLV